MKTGIKIILFGIMLFSCMREYKENPEEERKKAQKVYDFHLAGPVYLLIKYESSTSSSGY